MKKIQNQSIIKKYLKIIYINVLLKLIPTKAESIKSIYINLINFYKNINFLFTTSILKLKSPHLFKLPKKHIYALNVLLKISKELKKKEIEFFLLGGTLLGSIRQEAFAGRPSDIDLGLKYPDQKKFLGILEKFKKIINIYEIKKIKRKNFLKVQLVLKNILVDFDFFKKKSSKNSWHNPYQFDTNNREILFSDDELLNLKKIKLYGHEFFSTANPKKYLKKKFGKNWKKPDKKQFFWRKIKI